MENTTGYLPSSPPANTVLPAVSGTAQVGQTLSTTNGSWSNSPNGFTYQWQACSPGCSNISAATGQTYVPVAGDVGKTIQVVVTATNNNGSTPATSNQTAAVTNVPPPANTVLPAVSGTAQQGQTLSSSTGTWTNSPTGYAYQWQRCNSGGTSCSNISAATSQTYLLVLADVGATIRVAVTATNAGGPAAPPSRTRPLLSRRTRIRRPQTRCCRRSRGRPSRARR